MIQMPEIVLKKIIDSIIAKIVSDYSVPTDKSKTFLNKAFDGLIAGNYNFLEQAVKIMIKSGDDPRQLDTRLMFDKERATLPTIHVTIPNETPYSDGIGFDEGYQQNTVIDEGVDEEDEPIPPTSMTSYYTRGYSMKFDMLITGSNSFEVVLIHYILKMGLINNLESLELNGFRNPKIYGGDLRINDNLAAYMRVLTLDSFYELNVPKFENISIVNNITFGGKPYGN